MRSQHHLDASARPVDVAIGIACERGCRWRKTNGNGDSSAGFVGAVAAGSNKTAQLLRRSAEYAAGNAAARDVIPSNATIDRVECIASCLVESGAFRGVLHAGESIPLTKQLPCRDSMLSLGFDSLLLFDARLLLGLAVAILAIFLHQGTIVSCLA